MGAVILSAGFEPFDAKLLKEFGYGRFKNVLTSMDFERILSSTGPYEGEIRRTSDLKHPKKIAWIQCIGSRSSQKPANSYCSSVCCTYTQKQVILTKDHAPDAQCTVFHNDIRAYGKDFERLLSDQGETGMRLLSSAARSLPGRAGGSPDNSASGDRGA